MLFPILISHVDYFHYSYTLLVGKPPFETSCLKETYVRIKRNEYHIPSSKVAPKARGLIQRLLQADPTQRPTMEQVLADEFFTSGQLVCSTFFHTW